MPFIPAALLPAIIGGAATVGTGVYAANKASGAAKQQQQQADQMFARTQPAFDQAFQYYSNLLKGSPQDLAKALGPDLNNTGMFFDQARKNMLNSAQARGGSLTSGLAGIEGQRALALSNLVGGARQGAASALGNLASGHQLQGLQALAASQQGQMMNAQMQSQALSGIGGFLTRILSTPGLFGSGNQPQLGGGPGYPSYPYDPNFAGPTLPSTVVGGSGQPEEINYFPNKRA